MALIGLISDVHATPEPVAEALSIFAEAGVTQILCAGDIAGYMEQLDATIQLLIGSHCQSVTGNHDRSYIDHAGAVPETDALRFLKQLPRSYETIIEGKKLFMVHAQPPDGYHGGIKLLDKQGIVQPANLALWRQKLQPFDYDVLVVGHTHQVFAEHIGDSFVINPGSSVFNHSCAILSLPEMTVRFFPLSGKTIEKTWNWGEHMIYRNNSADR
ncbi:MAG TPA: metallophosphoesterase [Gammaproteobacteria bacterium]|nr:metallophosphoesterase [Gammaproteobacteria bacterium]